MSDIEAGREKETQKEAKKRTITYHKADSKLKLAIRQPYQET